MDLFRKELKQFRPYVQGKPIEEVAREYELDRIEKLASNECQFGPSPKAVAAMQNELSELHFYPEGYPYELIKKISSKLSVPEKSLVVGNGGESLIWNISMTFLNEGESIIMADPSFDIYAVSATLMGGKVIKVPLSNGEFDIDAMLDEVDSNTKLFYLCTPNNPTGNIASYDDIDRVISALPEHTVLILDEAYYEFASRFDDYPRENTEFLSRRENTIILRTFSKAYGIAGVRVGYAITSEKISTKMNAVKQTFGVNRLAIAGAMGALDDDEYRDEVTTRNKQALEFLCEYFNEKGWDYIPSYANFIWVNLDEDSKLIFEALQQRGVIVRPGFLWGWPTWIRVSTGTQEQMEFFISQLDATLESISVKVLTASSSSDNFS